MKYISYFLYITIYETLVLGGCGYAVFVLGHNGGWFLLASFLGGCAYTPERYIHGIIFKEDD